MKINKKHPLYHLLPVLYIFIIDFVLLSIALIIDGKNIDNSTQGHPAPALSIVAFILLCVITTVVIVISFYKTISSFIKRNKEQIINDEYENKSEESMSVWKAFRPILLLPIKYYIDVAVLLFASSKVKPLEEGQLGFPISAELIIFGLIALLTSAVMLVVVAVIVIKRVKILRKNAKKETGNL